MAKPGQKDPAQSARARRQYRDLSMGRFATKPVTPETAANKRRGAGASVAAVAAGGRPGRASGSAPEPSSSRALFRGAAAASAPSGRRTRTSGSVCIVQFRGFFRAICELLI